MKPKWHASWRVASEGERGCSKFVRMRGGDEVVLEGMASGDLIMVVEDGGGCGKELGIKEGRAEDAARREGGREEGVLTHEESSGGGGGAWSAAALREEGRTDHAFGSVGWTLAVIRWR